jgi:DNA-binding SARP family transcriptional activator
LGGLGISVDSDEGGTIVERPLPVQLKPLAVLAYLALAPDGAPIRRDTLVGIFWPESAQRTARGALRQTLYHLRQVVGPDALVGHGSDPVGVAPDRLWCDAVAAERAVNAGDLDGALKLYTGDLLDGVYLADAGPQFEWWLDKRRAQCREMAGRAAWTLADRAAAAGAHDEVARWAERAAAVDLDDEAALRRCLLLLDRCGQVSCALRIADRAIRWLAHDDASLSPETTALIVDLKARVASRPATIAVTEAPASIPPLDRVEAPIPVPTARRQRYRPSFRHVAMLVAVVTVAAALTNRGMSSEAHRQSPLARAFYDEGLRTFHLLDYHGAARLFHRALAEDTTCAVCAYQASVAEIIDDGPSSMADLRRAMHLAPLTSPSQQLELAVAAAGLTNSPTQLAMAERLADRDPGAASSDLALGRARVVTGDFLGAVAPLERAIQRAGRGQSLADTGTVTDARSNLAIAYVSADSLAAAERVLRAWIRAEPRSTHAWRELSLILGREYRFNDAVDATREATRRGSSASDALGRAILAVRMGDFTTADHLLEAGWQDGDDATRDNALWWSVLSLRTQGRMREALDVARRYRHDTERPPFLALGGSDAVLPEAQVLFEMGRFHEAAALFQDMSVVPPEEASVAPGQAARHRVWLLTHVAAALAAAGDPAVRAIADTVAAIAPNSGYGRDRHLPYHLRGLIALGDGRLADAEREFRLAIGSTTEGYARTQLELGRILLDTGRPIEAVAILRPVLRGPIESGSYYTTLTEIHAMLARAYEAAGQSDSAVAHYHWVATAWGGGDPSFARRAADARRHLRR